MAGFARWCFAHRKAVLAGWLIALIGFFAIGLKVGANYTENDSLPGTDSTQALSVLQANYPTQAGDSDQIVVQARQGTLRSPGRRGRRSVHARPGRQASVCALGDLPYGPRGQISKDGTIGLATVNLTAQANSVPNSAVQTLISTAQSADRPLLNVQLGGAAVENVVPSGEFTSVILGIALALVVLFIAFRRSVLAALLPLDLGAGGDRGGPLEHRHSSRTPSRSRAGCPTSPSSWRSAWAWTTRCSSSPAPQRLARRADPGGRRRHRGQHVRPRRPAGRPDRVRRAARAVRAPGQLPVRGGGGGLAGGRPDQVASLTLLPTPGFLGPKVLRRAERRMLAEQGRQVEQAEASGSAGPKGSAAGR